MLTLKMLPVKYKRAHTAKPWKAMGRLPLSRIFHKRNSIDFVTLEIVRQYERMLIPLWRLVGC